MAEPGGAEGTVVGGLYAVAAGPGRPTPHGARHDAVRVADGVPVELELLRPALAADPGVLARLASGGDSLRSLAGRHVVGVLHVLLPDTPGGVAGLVRDRFPSVLLADARRLEGGTVEPRQAVTTVVEVLSGLVEVHTAGLVHGALSERDVLMDTSVPLRTVVRVTGYGAAALLGRPVDVPLPPGSTAVPSPADDVWAAGALLGQLLLGSAAPRPDLLHDAGLPPSLLAALLPLLDPDPAARPSAEAARAALAAVLPALDRLPRLAPLQPVAAVSPPSPVLAPPPSPPVAGAPRTAAPSSPVPPPPAVPPSGGSRLPDLPPPAAGSRVDLPAPPSADRVDLPPPPPADTRTAALPPPAPGARAAALPPPADTRTAALPSPTPTPPPAPGARAAALPPPADTRTAALPPPTPPPPPGARAAALPSPADTRTAALPPPAVAPVVLRADRAAAPDTEPRSGRRTGALVGVGVVTVLALLVGLLAAGVFRPDDAPEALAPAAAPQQVAPFRFDVVTRPDGLRLERTWRLDLDGRTLRASTTVLNTTGAAVVADVDEVVPKEVASDTSSLTFRPEPSAVVQEDPVVRYRLGRMPPGARRGWEFDAVLRQPVTTASGLADLAGAAEQARLAHEAEHPVARPPARLLRLSLAPTTLRLQVGQTARLVVSARLSDGRVVTGAAVPRVTVRSSDARVVQNQGGVVRGRAPGQAVVVAQSGSTQARATVVVLAPPAPLAVPPPVLPTTAPVPSLPPTTPPTTAPPSARPSPAPLRPTLRPAPRPSVAPSPRPSPRPVKPSPRPSPRPSVTPSPRPPAPTTAAPRPSTAAPAPAPTRSTTPGPSPASPRPRPTF